MFSSRMANASSLNLFEDAPNLSIVFLTTFDYIYLFNVVSSRSRCFHLAWTTQRFSFFPQSARIIQNLLQISPLTSPSLGVRTMTKDCPIQWFPIQLSLSILGVGTDL
ncbi:hypothetical protein B9Z55_026302 [Caenorhabditis nigoni]|uniref:Uncharacterized protein n=1 Tax=Caenorhabditis nigoni TaxID=1611254 RepID=A0A2G5T2V0_9PELO|nr:hypothetical protein B9Z55_026302 [Caenorhabditis nigoni]